MKEGPNKGRQFYRCGKDADRGDCNFFKWVDEYDPSAPSSSTTSAPRQMAPTPYNPPPATRTTNTNSASVEPRCLCDNYAILLQANNGRKFWGCQNQSQRSRCNYFEWANEEDVTGIPVGTRNSHASKGSGAKSFAGGSGGGDGTCFKVGDIFLPARTRSLIDVYF